MQAKHRLQAQTAAPPHTAAMMSVLLLGLSTVLMMRCASPTEVEFMETEMVGDAVGLRVCVTCSQGTGDGDGYADTDADSVIDADSVGVREGVLECNGVSVATRDTLDVHVRVSDGERVREVDSVAVQEREMVGDALSVAVTLTVRDREGVRDGVL